MDFCERASSRLVKATIFLAFYYEPITYLLQRWKNKTRNERMSFDSNARASGLDPIPEVPLAACGARRAQAAGDFLIF